MDGVLHVTGGSHSHADGNNIHNLPFTAPPDYIYDDVLTWDPVAETWGLVGQLAQYTHYHALMSVPLADLGC